MNRFALIIIASILLMSCTNETATIRYYKLASNSNSSVIVDREELKNQQELVILEPIILAEFLRRKGLVIQKNEYQIQISNIHRWAEELDRATARLIREALETKLSNYRVEDQNSRWKSKPSFRISIELNQFQVNHKNQTVTSGQFWIFGKNRELKAKKHFNFEIDLDQDGYEHAISQLESSLVNLSELIAIEVSEIVDKVPE